jgi:hypothetical protein
VVRVVVGRSHRLQRGGDILQLRERRRRLLLRLLRRILLDLLEPTDVSLPRVARGVSKRGHRSYRWRTSRRRRVWQLQRRKRGTVCARCETSNLHIGVGR